MLAIAASTDTVIAPPLRPSAVVVATLFAVALTFTADAAAPAASLVLLPTVALVLRLTVPVVTAPDPATAPPEIISTWAKASFASSCATTATPGVGPEPAPVIEALLPTDARVSPSTVAVPTMPVNVRPKLTLTPSICASALMCVLSAVMLTGPVDWTAAPSPTDAVTLELTSTIAKDALTAATAPKLIDKVLAVASIVECDEMVTEPTLPPPCPIWALLPTEAMVSPLTPRRVNDTPTAAPPPAA